MKYKKILISTGGTGGHVFPAYSLAKYCLKKDFLVEVITDNRGLRYLKNFDNLSLKVINSSTIFNKNPFLVLISIFKILIAFVKSIVTLIKLRPKLVIGMGGYSSFPVCIAAKTLAIPFVIYENNLFLGKANRYLLPHAKKLFVAYSDLEGVEKKYKKKVIKIGNLIREDIFHLKTSKVNLSSEEINILVLGGSQAAKSFAEKLPEIFKKCYNENIKVNVIQQCLIEQQTKLKNDYELFNIKCEIFNFSYNLFDYFKKTDIAITRSGASMLAELLNCNIPFISVPLPSSADNHQLKNAEYFEKKGYGLLIEENKIETNLFQLIKSIHKDKSILNEIKNKQTNHSDKEVFKNIYNQIEILIND